MKVAFVTGASRGLGAGWVEFLSSQGYFVYASVRKTQNFAQHKNVRYVLLDVTSDAQIRRAIARVRKEQGHIDVLVNNAAINADSVSTQQPLQAVVLAQLERDAVRELIEVNAISPIMVTKHALPLMTRKGCFIINVSSDVAVLRRGLGKFGNYGYRVSKVALNMLTLASLFDLPANVSTFAVHPGWVKTDMNPNGVLSPRESAARIMQITKHWDVSLNGRFLTNDGSVVE